MWAEHEKYNNHFLQTQLKHLQPQKINEMVSKEIKRNQSVRTEIEKNPSGRTEIKKTQSGTIHCQTTLCCKESCKSANYFENRAEIAYGFYDLPKLMKEMACDDYLTHFKAINSLAEYVVNPLNAQRAIKEFGIVRRCQNVFLRIRFKFIKVEHQEICSLLDIFYNVAMHKTGGNKIVNKFRQLTQFYIIIRDREVYMERVARILPFISQDPSRLMQLIDIFKVYDKLEPIFKRDICVPYYPEDFWLHLTHIFEADPQQAIDHGFFEILHTRIKGRLFQYHRWDMKCFGLLLNCPEGQQRFVDIDGVKELYAILTDDDHKLDSYENVVFTLVSGLMAKAILWRCREFTDFPLVITKLAKDKENNNQQLLCFQTIREMGEMPCIKRFTKENCLEDLKNIECETLDNEKARNEIVYWLEREIYHTTDL